MKTIYNTYVVMESQEQCDRMKRLCIDNNLPVWKYECAFRFMFPDLYFFYNEHRGFSVDAYDGKPKEGYIKLTEEEFKELLKTK